MEDISPKSKLITVLLALFLGTLGLHRLYIGKIRTGLAILILSILGWVTMWVGGLGFIFLTIVFILVFVDFLMALFGAMKDSEGRPIKSW